VFHLEFQVVAVLSSGLPLDGIVYEAEPGLDFNEAVYGGMNGIVQQELLTGRNIIENSLVFQIEVCVAGVNSAAGTQPPEVYGSRVQRALFDALDGDKVLPDFPSPGT